MESDFVFSVFSKCRFGYFVSSMEVRNETSVVVSSGIKFFGLQRCLFTIQNLMPNQRVCGLIVKDHRPFLIPCSLIKRSLIRAPMERVRRTDAQNF